MSKVNLDYFHEKFMEIPADVLTKAAEVIKTFPEKTKTDVSNAIKEFGQVEWIHKSVPWGHFFFGMSIRNKLRDHNVTDDLFPDQNLDDYYVQIVEYALGFRDRA